MAAADLVITSPGGTCAEARVVGRPGLGVLPGHGRDNLQHELELGSAPVTSGRPRDIVASALAALAAGDEMAPAYGAGDWAAAFSAALAELDLAGPRPGTGPP